MKNSLLFLILSPLFLINLSCEPKGIDDIDFNTRVEGTIDGQRWTHQGGQAADNPFAPGMIKVQLWNGTTDTVCMGPQEFAQQLNFLLPNAPGVYKLGYDVGQQKVKGLSVTFQSLKNGHMKNTVATEGFIEILEFKQNSIRGRMDVKVDGDNFVNGNFEVPYCP